MIKEHLELDSKRNFDHESELYMREMCLFFDLNILFKHLKHLEMVIQSSSIHFL